VSLHHGDDLIARSAIQLSILQFAPQGHEVLISFNVLKLRHRFETIVLSKTFLPSDLNLSSLTREKDPSMQETNAAKHSPWVISYSRSRHVLTTVTVADIVITSKKANCDIAIVLPSESSVRASRSLRCVITRGRYFKPPFSCSFADALSMAADYCQ